MTNKLVRNTFALTNALGQRDTFTGGFSIAQSPGAPVVVNHSSLGNLFIGPAFAAQISEHADGGVTSSIQCASIEQLFDRRMVGQVSYVDTPLGDVFTDLHTRFMGGEDLTATAVVSGPNITITFDFCTVREAYDQACAMASDDTDVYMWDCRNRVTRLYMQTSFPAPFDATDASGNVLRPVTVAWSFADYCNKVFVRVPEFTTDPRTQVFSGDGAATEFTCDLPLAAAPTIDLLTRTADVSSPQTYSFTTDGSSVYYAPHDFVAVSGITVSGSGSSDFTWTVGDNRLTDITGLASGLDVVVSYMYDLGTSSPSTVSQTVGVLSVDTGKDWYWASGSPTITQDGGGTVVPFPDQLQVVFQGTQSTVIDAGQNDDAVAERSVAEGGSGWYMKLIDASRPGVLSDALALGASYLGKHSTVPFSYEYRTEYGGVRAGMYQRCASSKFGTPFDSTFIVESSTLMQEAGQWFWRVRCVNGAMAGGWLAKLRKLGRGTSSSAAGITGSDTSGVAIDGVLVTY